MAQRSWFAVLGAALVLAAGGVQAEEAAPEQPAIVGIDAHPEDGRTLVRVHTTSGSVNYISYTRDATTLVVDLYGLEVGDVPRELAVGSAEVSRVRLEHSPPADGYTAVTRLIVDRPAPGTAPIHAEGSTLVIEARRGARPARVTLPAAAERAEPAAAGPATRLDGLETDVRDGGLSVSIQGDGRLSYDSFTLEDPPRLVIDVKGVDNHLARGQFAVGHAAVDRIRVSQFRPEPDKVARIVFDLNRPEEYRIAARGTTLNVRFGDALAAPEEPLAAIDLGAAEAAQGAPPGTPSGQVSLGVIEPEAQVHGAVAEEEGTLVSLDLKDADIKDVLRYFADISGLNIILDPGVSGTVTVRLIDVPWNKALDIILKSYGYGKTLEGNVLRIADVRKLAEEERASAALAKERLESRPLVTLTRQISYASAQEVANVIQQTALSQKGQIIIDQRTNTLVITEVDLPEYRQRILDLIRTLDAPTPQVEIEARIVETSSTYARSFGVQWGFNHAFDQSTGSTTDLVFPHSGIVRGDLVGGDSGIPSTLPGGGYAVNLPAQGANSAIGFTLANITDTFQLDLALSALETEGKGRILSAPKITTQSNVQASIVSGNSIPVQTIANQTVTVEYVSANLQLSVTPQVTAENTVVLRVTVQNSSADLSQSIGFAGLPPINQRQATTTVLVPDGGTAVIGGVFQLQNNDAQGRVPFLSQVPVLGWLFRNRNISRQNNELLIFITPKIKKPTGTGASAVPVAVNPGL